MRASKNAGFSMIFVVIIIALGALAGMTLLGLVSIDLDAVGSFRRAAEARALSRGGAREISARNDSVDDLPPLTPEQNASGASANPIYLAASADESGGVDGRLTLLANQPGQNYRYQFEPLRIAPCRDGGLNRLSGIWFEARIQGSSGRATDELRVEFCTDIPAERAASLSLSPGR